MTVSPARIVIVTLAMSLLGAGCGAFLGGLAALTHPPPGLLPRVFVSRFVLFGFEFGAFGGSVLGAVFSPIMSWIFLRRVALHRAIRQTALGVSTGITIGVLFPLGTALALGLLGFTLAGTHLWWVSRRRLAITNPPYNER